MNHLRIELIHIDSIGSAHTRRHIGNGIAAVIKPASCQADIADGTSIDNIGDGHAVRTVTGGISLCCHNTLGRIVINSGSGRRRGRFGQCDTLCILIVCIVDLCFHFFFFDSSSRLFRSALRRRGRRGSHRICHRICCIFGGQLELITGKRAPLIDFLCRFSGCRSDACDGPVILRRFLRIRFSRWSNDLTFSVFRIGHALAGKRRGFDHISFFIRFCDSGAFRIGHRRTAGFSIFRHAGFRHLCKGRRIADRNGNRISILRHTDVASRCNGYCIT